MRKINKLIYSCISMLVSIIYRPEHALGVITYKCNSHNDNVSYTLCPDTISEDLPYYTGPFIVKDLFPNFQDVQYKTLCAAGQYVYNCMSATGASLPEEDWDDMCSEYLTKCATCLSPGTSGASKKYYCPQSISSVTVVVCSSIKINSDGSYGGHDGNYMRTYTCMAECTNTYSNIINTISDCYAATGTALTDETGTYTCSENAYYE